MTDKKKDTKDLAVLRVKYAAYRRQQTADQDKAESLLGFKAWAKEPSTKSK